MYMENAKVNPIFKTGDKDSVNYYRPISLQSTLSKIIEKMDCDKTYVLSNKYQLLHKNHSFVKINQLDRLLYSWQTLG